MGELFAAAAVSMLSPLCEKGVTSFFGEQGAVSCFVVFASRRKKATRSLNDGGQDYKMQVTFLFWNLIKKPLAARVAQIAAHHDVDVVILAECATSLTDVEVALNQAGKRQWAIPFSLSTKLHLLTRLNTSAFGEQFDDINGRVSIRSVQLGTTPKFLLALVHFPSKRDNDRDDQTLLATDLAFDITRAEAESRLSGTIAVGDFNMNPHEPGMVGAKALHAVMTRADASREGRIVNGKSYRFFYNPMWSHFGDRTDGPPGTYFLQSSKPVNPFWNMYDQVLLRPQLMNNLREVRIINHDGVRPLVTASGRPDRRNASDHLPLLFRLEL